MGKTYLSILTDAELELIHAKTLDVFEKLGIRVSHDETLGKLKKAGAMVNDSTGLVRIPRQLVKELLALAPSSAMQTGLNGRMIAVGGENKCYASLILDLYVVDYQTGLRSPNLEDVRRNTIVGELYPYPLSRQKIGLFKIDSLPSITAVGTKGARRATEVPTATPCTAAGVL